MKINGKICSIINDLSPLRFAPYRQTYGSDINGLRAYRYNIVLGQAVWEASAILEVLLRNKITTAWGNWFFAKGITASLDRWPINIGPLHQSLIARFPRTPFDKNAFGRLEEQERVAYARARSELGRTRTIVNGDIVARLTFGFWHECLSASFRFINTSQIKDILPYYPYQHTHIEDDISEISTDLQSIRDFRNRLAHHERLDIVKAKKKYAQICEYISFINPHALHLVNTEGFDHIANFPIKEVTRNFPLK